MTEDANELSGAERRRSERVFLQIGIFAQGALIHLAQDVRPEEHVTLTNGYTEAQQACRVVYAKPMTGNVRAVGIEFLKPAPKFWGIDFPPTDWKPFEE